LILEFCDLGVDFGEGCGCGFGSSFLDVVFHIRVFVFLVPGHPATGTGQDAGKFGNEWAQKVFEGLKTEGGRGQTTNP
jgi:hypothetical protein